MAISLVHQFQSGKTDGADATLVQPSNWNAEHTMTMATAKILGRTTAGTGAVEELAAADVKTVLGTLTVPDGGTGVTSTTAYAVLCGGTTSTAALQSIADVGSSGHVLTSNGAGALPTFQAAAGGSPAGAGTEIQYRNAGSFGAMGGTAWDDTNRSLTITGATVTTSNPILNLTQTWNAGAVAFTGIKINVTDTASAAASMLADLQAGGDSKFQVFKNGSANIGPGLSSGRAVGALGLGNGGTNAWYLDPTTTVGTSSSQQLDIISFNSAVFKFTNANGSGIVGANNCLAWATSASAAFDVKLFRDDAAMLALRNGTTVQTFRVYSTYTDSSNYQRLTHAWNTTTALIHNEGAGTGADGSIAFNDAALATTATKGFIMIPSCAGAATGTPADIPTGQCPIVFDSTNNKLYIYAGGTWISTAALT